VSEEPDVFSEVKGVGVCRVASISQSGRRSRSEGEMACRPEGMG
jgi:hypothetical protein